MENFSINKYYHNFKLLDRMILRQKAIDKLGVNYSQFHQWITRDSIPIKFRKDFCEQVLEKPVEDFYPEMANCA